MGIRDFIKPDKQAFQKIIKTKTERFLRDWKTCDMTLIWRAQVDDKLTKIPRRRLENVKLGKIITKDFSQMIDENSLAIGKWGYILFGTCVIQKKKLAYLLVD